MKIIEPDVELWEQGDDKDVHVAKCARICYRSESNDDIKLIKFLLKHNHLSMFRHCTYYYIVPQNYAPIWIHQYHKAKEMDALIVGIDIYYTGSNYFVIANGQWILEHPVHINCIKQFEIEEKAFANYCEVTCNLMRYTFKVTTQISTSRELNRVSPNNIAEQSTRYVYEDGTICRPHWMTDEDYKIFKDEHKDDSFIPEHYLNNDDKIKIRKYVWSCDRSFFDYKNLIRLGMDRQDARGVLPFDTATVCAYTYSIGEWRAILDLRYYGTTGKPHPNAKLIAGMIRKKLMDLGHDFR